MSEPQGSTWAALLHWAVRALPLDDDDLSFTASLLSHALKHDGLTERQERYATKIIDRINGSAAGREECPSKRDTSRRSRVTGA